MKKLLLLGLFIMAPFTANAEGAGKGGDDFRETAKEYRIKATQAASAGQSENATIYTRLAEIKEQAARLADQGKWSQIDWSEYHALNAQLTNRSKHKSDTKYKK